MTKSVPPLIRKPCRIAIVGECPGGNEIVDKRPFTGASGQLLAKLCTEAGIDWNAVTLTYIFLERPRDNDAKNFFIKPKAFKSLGHDPKSTRRHPTHGYLDPAHLPALDRVLGELDDCGAEVVIATGGIAFWALGFDHKISAHRGVLHSLTLPSGRVVTVVGTYHPSMVMREWSYRPIVVADLRKAATGKSDERRPRTVRIPQTLSELKSLLTKYADAEFVAYDIETEAGQITHISLAPSATEVLVIPIWDRSKAQNSYWALVDELDVWRLLWKFFNRKRRWLTQNGSYDMTYLRDMFIKPNGTWEDTMLLHHAVFCEQPKSLGFMGSLYTSEAAWKELRVKKPKGKDIKSDE